MRQKRIGIIMHGVTGRMGMNQHLIRSVKAIRDQGGVVDVVNRDPGAEFRVSFPIRPRRG